MKANLQYTLSDHESRDEDGYAIAKYQWTLRKLSRLSKSRSGRLANIGCGTGTFTQMAAELGYQVDAYEPDPVAFSIASQRLPAGCNVANLGLFDIQGVDQFDLIVMHDVLEHIENDFLAVQKLSLLLKPGGILVISVPAVQFLFGRHDEQLGHFRRYSKTRLSKLLKSNFSIRELRYFGLLSIPIVLTFSRVLRRDYPSTSGNKLGFLHRLYGFICRVEQRIWEPLGTSLLVVCRQLEADSR